MKIKILSIFCFCLSLTVTAVQASAVAEGTEELRVNSNLELNTAAGTRASIELGYGYFMADYIEVGVFGGYGEDDIVTDIFGGAWGEYNFETGTQLVPFAGVQLGLHYADIELSPAKDSITAVVLGVYVGTKYFLTESVALSGRLLLEAATDDIYFDESKTTDSNFTVDVGFNFYF